MSAAAVVIGALRINIFLTNDIFRTEQLCPECNVKLPSSMHEVGANDNIMVETRG